MMTKQELLEKIQRAAQEKVTELDLGSQGLTELLPEIGHLTQLQGLDISNNQLTQLPPELGQLTRLRWLNLEGNQLTQLPPQLGQLTQLRWLDLSGNRLTQLPPELRKLTQLQQLDLGDNPLPVPPEILKKSDRPAEILNYYFNALKAGSRPLHEAKLLLVGQGGVGKTSLVNRLLHNTYDDHEPKTDGIAIAQWSVPTPEQDSIRLNIWDFGGQEIMHATHQFFLTHRSLYILVLDARQGEQESRVEYWLKLIQSFGGESPILVAINKTDEHKLDINRKGLQGKYPRIQAFFDISCKKGTGLDDLKQHIQNCVHNYLPHVHDPFPGNWFSVKDTLGKMKEDYLSYDEYQKMCHREGITDEISQRTLIGFLHDLGIALNFRDDPLRPQLAETNILNPEWVTQGVYKLLNNPALTDNKGVLAVTQLTQLLDAHRYPSHKQHLIVEIMEKFELCFAFEQRQRFLIPELLPKEEPTLIEWDESQQYRSLRFEYHYDVLPSSVISRFIVRLHENILDKTYWRTGVVLAMDNNQALVKADLEDKKIFIWVTGNPQGKRALLGVIRSQFEEIHRSISKIQVMEQVPYKGIVIPYLDLLSIEEEGLKTHFLPKLKEWVNVKELLDGIRGEETASEEDNWRKVAEVTIDEYNKKKPKNYRLAVESGFLLGLIIYSILSLGLGSDPIFNVIMSIASGIISGYLANRLN